MVYYKTLLLSIVAVTLLLSALLLMIYEILMYFVSVYKRYTDEEAKARYLFKKNRRKQIKQIIKDNKKRRWRKLIRFLKGIK